MTSLAVLLAASLAACSSAGPGDDGADAGADARPGDANAGDGGGPAATLRYHQVQQKSSHNSFQRHEALLDQLIYHRLRSLELDIHIGRSGDTTPGDWYVYHTALDSGTTCYRLSDCLADIGAVQEALPEHEVVTLWIDLKDAFGPQHQPADLDALLASALPPGSIFGPGDLLDACPGAADLRAAVTGDCAWPTLAALRSRFIIVLTGAAGSGPGDRLYDYVYAGGDVGAHQAFVAPTIGDASQITGRPDMVFLNMPSSVSSVARDVNQAGLVARVWGLNDAGSWNEASAAMANHLATDKVNRHQDPWARTDNDSGWPFTCLQSCVPEPEEPGRLIGIEVDSGDIWDSSDSFVFAQTTDAPPGPLSFTGFVSAVNSHVDGWAKGCLMARASSAADAAYFAVCRPADEDRLRVQTRLQTGAGSAAVEADITAPDTIAPESVIFVRLDLDAERMCATGLGSQNGRDWVSIAAQCFAEPLTVHGLAAASHGSGPVTLYFGNVSRTDTSDTQVFDSANLAPLATIGPGASGTIFDQGAR